MRVILLLLFFAFSNSAYSQLIEHQFLPSQTDPAITGHNQPHYAYLNDTVSKLNKLLLFFPGTGALPWDYRMFQQTAANLGYHSLGLCYENLQSINLDICPATHDSTCHRRARYEIWFGVDTHDSLNINFANSIVNRFVKAVKYLSINYPSENWGQFLINDSTINWSKVVTSGHSQGAGHAAFGSKYFKVNKVLMVSWIDWVWPGKPADWVRMPGQTHDSSYYGFIHTGDASIYSGIPTTWAVLGMLNYGQIVKIDTTVPPYYNTHSLITSIPIDTTPTQPNFHNCTLVDWVTPIDSVTGLPVLLPVWKYLLKNYSSTVNIKNISSGADSRFNVFPNPAKDFIKITGNTDYYGLNVEIYNLLGQRVGVYKNSDYINILNLSAGVYFMRMISDNEIINFKFFKY